MTNIDQFESVFKAADKTPFALETIEFQSALVITDLRDDSCSDFADRVARYANLSDANWARVEGREFSTVDELLQAVNDRSADLICSYRNLKAPAPDHPYSLGVFVDVLTQATSIPVLLLPNPRVALDADFDTRGRASVMAITDHLTGDHHLVSSAARMTDPGGTLFLSHVEDEATFERYISTISRIPSIDTDEAREAILHQLLKEPHDYILSCRQVLEHQEVSIEIEESVTLGHHLTDYKRLIDEHSINLLVMNTKDEDQLAMHGLAYPLAVELRDTPMLLL